MTEFMKKRFSVMMSSGNDDGCKCFKGDLCKWCDIKCKQCELVHGRWSEYEASEEKEI